MSVADDLLLVRVRIQGARAAAAEMATAAAGVAGFGVASEEAAVKTRLANVETRALQQGLYTLRRYAFYGTTAVLAFGAASLKLGFSFDETKSQGTQAFTAILGGAGVAGREMETLIGLTHLTGIGLSTLTGGAETMQGFGFSIRAVNTDLAALANYAERSGRGASGLSALVEVFDRIRQSGKLTSLDLRTLNTQGISGLQILTRQLHLTALQASQLRAGKLIIPASMALPALASGIGARAGQLGPGLGQQVGIAHSYLSSLLGGGEGGVFSFATQGLERLNAAFKVKTAGGGFLKALDPSGQLLLGWKLLAGGARAVAGGFLLIGHVLSPLVKGLGWLIGGTQQLAGHSRILTGGLVLIGGALKVLTALYILDRTRLLAVWGAQKLFNGELIVSAALTRAWTTAQWLLNFAMDANPIGVFVLAVAGLVGILYLLEKRYKAVRDVMGTAPGGLFANPFGKGGVLNEINPWKSGFQLHVPKLAAGGTALTGGWSMVGENGPEYRYMPRGASIVPLSRAGGSDGGFVLEQHIYLDGEEITNAVVKTTVRRQKLANAVFQAQGVAAARA